MDWTIGCLIILLLCHIIYSGKSKGNAEKLHNTMDDSSKSNEQEKEQEKEQFRLSASPSNVGYSESNTVLRHYRTVDWSINSSDFLF